MKETGAEGRLRKAGEGSSAWAFVPVGGKQEWNQLSGLGLLLHQERGPGHVHKPQGPEVVGRPVPDTLPVCPQAFCCPYCSFLSPESEQVRAHALSQHAVQPTFRCPLCQEQLVGRPALHFHLSHLHNVVPECVERLLLVVSPGGGGQWLCGWECVLKEVALWGSDRSRELEATWGLNLSGSLCPLVRKHH